jgi:hypothetical protein
MKKLILDSTFRSKLGDLNEPLELCDETGKALGRFTPLTELEMLYRSEPQFCEEELLKIEQEPDMSTAELLEHLENS